MNQSLNALMTKLAWQRNELHTHLHAVDNESIKVKQQLEEIEQQVNQSSTRSSTEINPELEISRLNFITLLQQQKEELMGALKNHQALESKLKDKLQRVMTEIRMLEKYLDREQHSQRKQQEKVQEQHLEEWVIQRRNTYEDQ
ncbi:hypothetical protein [Legionella fallonii]|uniref:Flagellar FliJ protein n=1 Tax=Legionella fallonii LLAP-10 TaxID=1212491 RepID=A0A098G4N2_9GAMM|nr:hypothetical protein [Legionella fallonii]CEG57448.1 conserved protein of unknown function [Legionella fallonii LLAP-10]